MAPPANKNDAVLIVGAGTFGLATALSLARAGYTNVTVLEKDDQIPSRFSGAYDINKVIRAEYADPFYTPIALDAIRKWQTDPLYQQYFRQTGFLNVATDKASQVIKDAVEKYLVSVTRNPSFKEYVTPVSDPKTIKSLAPQFTADLKGWKGYFNSLAGYAHSSNALQAVYEACQRLGVRFITGQAHGDVAELLYENGSKACTGVRTRSGAEHRAKTTILALGAAVGRLLPSIGSQVKGRCWGVAHVQLTAAEAAKMRGMPVTNVRDIGFFFEPDPVTAKLKICHMGGGYTNHQKSAQGVSVPYASLEESDYILQEDVEQMRRLLRETYPELANRPLIDAHLCWFADTADSDYIVDFVPGAGTSLAVLSGDSGHGFKMLPIFGDWTRDLLAKGSQDVAKWKWKATGKSGEEEQVAWRSSASQDLSKTTRARL